VPLSLVHYHFGSKHALLAAVLEHENEMLLARQRDLYAAPGPLAEKWRTACAFLDEDIGSGYVRVLWELWAAGPADQALAERWRSTMGGWRELLQSVVANWADELEIALPLSPRPSPHSSPTSSRESKSSFSPASTRTTPPAARY
jgi:AcrR family transcriptional regulator